MNNTYITAGNMTQPGKARQSSSSSLNHRIRVLEQLKQCGVSRWAFRHSEIAYLPQLIHPDEQIGGVSYGHSRDGFIVLVATDRRVIYLDKKPMLVRSEDIAYDSVAAITLQWVGLSGTVILHTRLGDFQIKTTSRSSAEIFKRYIENRCIEKLNGMPG